IRRLRDKAREQILNRIPYVRVNGSMEHRLPGNLNVSFEFIEGESLLLLLDMKGIKASSGSACTSGSLDPSHVLLAIGLPHEIAHGSLRLSFGEANTEEEVDYLVDCLAEIVERLRSMSPLYEDFLKANK
ncbi:MAG TPA: aminotransferase class V-fold PLP-dependent enzyme, partial [Thermoclostridium caenicola]|nr:aminotransferase class V-fold PLP-dependent enzyme [Thermoclostridium caenicola]